GRGAEGTLRRPFWVHSVDTRFTAQRSRKPKVKSHPTALFGVRQLAKGPSGNKVYILLLAPRPAGKARATSIPGAVCKERATPPAGLRAAARRGAAARARIGFVAAPRRCTPASPASRRLASARPTLAPKCTPYFLTGPNLGHRRDGHDTKIRLASPDVGGMRLLAPADVSGLA